MKIGKMPWLGLTQMGIGYEHDASSYLECKDSAQGSKEIIIGGKWGDSLARLLFLSPGKIKYEKHDKYGHGHYKFYLTTWEQLNIFLKCIFLIYKESKSIRLIDYANRQILYRRR